ncbi:hypothetical protein [Rhodanobacter koreensis]
MKRKPWLMGAVVAAALLQASAVCAYKTEVLVKADNKDDFATLVVAVRQQMQPGGRYEFVDARERETVETNLAAMQSLLDKYGTVAQMDMSAKIQLFNDQEVVNAILTRRDDERLVCESVPPLGSHIPRTSCRTYREIETERRDIQNLKMQMLQVPAIRAKKGNG